MIRRWDTGEDTYQFDHIGGLREGSVLVVPTQNASDVRLLGAIQVGCQSGDNQSTDDSGHTQSRHSR